MGSVGVILPGVLVRAFGWPVADPILSVLIGLLIWASSWSLLQKIFQVLLQATPERQDMYRLCSTMEDEPGITLIYDVHAWTVTSDYEVLTAHVPLEPSLFGEQVETVLCRLRHIASDEFGIAPITLQVEQSVAGCTEDHHVGHVEAAQRSSGRRFLPF